MGRPVLNCPQLENARGGDCASDASLLSGGRNGPGVVFLASALSLGSHPVADEDAAPDVIGFPGVGVEDRETEEDKNNCDHDKGVEVGALHGRRILAVSGFVRQVVYPQRRPIDRNCVYEAYVRSLAGRPVPQTTFCAPSVKFRKWERHTGSGGLRVVSGCRSAAVRVVKSGRLPFCDAATQFKTYFGRISASSLRLSAHGKLARSPPTHKTPHALKTAISRCGAPENGLLGVL